LVTSLNKAQRNWTNSTRVFYHLPSVTSFLEATLILLEIKKHRTTLTVTTLSFG